jgi:hypothetical protein
MSRFFLAVALAGAFVSGGLLLNGTKSVAAQPRPRGQLYPNWKQLGLTEEQVLKIYTIQSKHRGEIQKLELQIKALKKKEREEAVEVLTPAQKQRLKEIATGTTEKPKDKVLDKPKVTDKKKDK